jgi:hypothetical protein
MMKIKICPHCETEYNSHIEKCADCGAVLLLPEEITRIQEERKQCMTKLLENPVIVREGDLKWMDELFEALVDSGIPCVVNSNAGCKKGCCGEKFQLMVSAKDAEKARERIEEYYAEIDPEIHASNQLMDQGKCPACATPVGDNAVECPDCGLTLIIME